MTREEAVKKIRSWDFLSGDEIEALETLVPEYRENNGDGQGLDEAAEKYRRDSCNAALIPNIDGPMSEYGGSVKDAFKAGATWREQQILKLPYNLDEAAEKWCKENCKGFVLRDKTSRYVGDGIDAFKAGAEWMAGQGVTCEGYIVDEIAYNGVGIMLENEGSFKPGDKVIVQIRKK